MESWPVDSRTPDATLPAPKRQGPRKVRPEPYWNTPLIDAGALGSSRLSLQRSGNSKNFRWSNIVEAGPRLSVGNTRCILPPTREESRRNIGTSLEQKGIRASAWLRTNKDIQDIDAAFLRGVLEEEESYGRHVLSKDTYKANLLAMSFISRGHKKRAGILAYPMGQYFQHIGASVLFDEKWGTVVVPSERPVWTAQSPICQITSAGSIHKPSTDYKKAGCLFAARTLFDVNFVSINPKPGANDPARASLVGSFNSADIGGRRPFHVAMNPDQSPDCLVISDIGTVWSAGLDTPPQVLYSSVEDPSARVGAHDLPYWEVAWGSHPETLLLGSRSCLSLYDRRASKVSSVFGAHLSTLSSFDLLRNEGRTRIFLCDTERVTLLDERMFTRPLVSWKHRRTYDKVLRITALSVDGKHAGLLSSGNSQLVSVYDPVVSENGNLKTCDSYSLEFGTTSNSPLASIAAYIPAVPLRSGARGTLFRLTETGAIYRQDLSIGVVDPTGEDEIWAHEIQRLALRIPLEREECDPMDLVKNTEISLRREYSFIFGNESLDRYLVKKPSVLDVVDLAPSALQRCNEPIDKIMTLHDMIRVVSQESTGASPRALFTSGNSLPLPDPLLLLKFVGQLHAQTRDSVSWSSNLSETQQRLCPTLLPAPTLKELAAFSTRHVTALQDRDLTNMTDEQAREEISLDLALAMTTYSSLPFQPSRPRLPPAPLARDDDELLSVAASALNLEETEPPQLEHIQPCPTEGLVDGTKGAEQRQSLVVRLLASEWDPDSSVDDYEFFDPYGQDYDESMPAWKLSARTKADRQTLQRAKSAFSMARAGPSIPSFSKPLPLPSMQIPRPKLPVPAPLVTGVKKGPSRLVESQPEPTVTQTMSSQPRELDNSQLPQARNLQIPSTQILAGPFGGRPGATPARKKKPRLAGF
ncbi:RNA polymerase I-specific transcription-initiation factor [Ceratobasidium sp. AG-Ba]|nr:RNA polymerase I-specific transcription-initiation factor [Ceratobasidium sp. AG-Ba]